MNLKSRMLTTDRTVNAAWLSDQHDNLVHSLLVAAARHLVPDEWGKAAEEAVQLADRIYPKPEESDNG